MNGKKLKKKAPRRNLTLSKIKKVVAIIDEAAKQSRVKYCLIGGALFKTLGVPRYQTPDVDCAANGDIKEGVLKNIEHPTIFSWNRNGHYDVLGVKVDFINKLQDGTKKLYLHAVKRRKKVDGMWCARIEDALAIRMAAGRDKDVKVVIDFANRGLVDIKKVARIVMKHAPVCLGADWARKILGKAPAIRDIFRPWNETEATPMPVNPADNSRTL